MTLVSPVALNLLKASPFCLWNEPPDEEKGENAEECVQPEGDGCAQCPNKGEKGDTHEEVGNPVRKRTDAGSRSAHSRRKNLRTHQPEDRAKTERKRHDIND